jgi:hypothetical protein
MTRGKKIALGCLGVFLLAAIIFVFSARRFIFPEKLDVVSIRTESTFQNPALLQRAFALPVAAQYQRAPIAFQPNGSFCGPTSLADVWRTLGRPEVTPAQVLEGTELCATGICFGGLTLDDLAGVVRNRIQSPCDGPAQSEPRAVPRALAPLERARPSLRAQFRSGAIVWNPRWTSLAGWRLSGRRGLGARARRKREVPPVACAFGASLPGDGHHRSRNRP